MKQDWNPGTEGGRILGWAVVNLDHPDVSSDRESPAAVFANESGWIYRNRRQAEDVAQDAREEFENDRILVVAVLAPRR